MNDSPRKLILYHFRRSRIGEVESDTVDFNVILEKDGKRFKVGQRYTEGTPHKPRDIYKLLEQGWKLVAVQSCYKWAWDSRRYVGEDHRTSQTEEDVYGRAYVNDLWFGYYDIVFVQDRGSFWEKVLFNSTSLEEKVKGSIPEDVKDLFENTEWMA